MRRETGSPNSWPLDEISCPSRPIPCNHASPIATHFVVVVVVTVAFAFLPFYRLL